MTTAVPMIALVGVALPGMVPRSLGGRRHARPQSKILMMDGGGGGGAAPMRAANGSTGGAGGLVRIRLTGLMSRSIRFRSWACFSPVAVWRT